MDAGVQPLTEDYAVQFQVDPTLSALGPVFQNITIQNTSLDGSLGFHQVQNAAVISSVITTSLQWLGYAADATDISFVDVQPVGKQLSAALDPWGQSKPVVTYSTSASNEFGSVGRSTREPVVKGK
jgi:hypothetical protein